MPNITLDPARGRPKAIAVKTLVSCVAVFSCSAYGAESGQSCRELFGYSARDTAEASGGFSELDGVSKLKRLFFKQGQADWTIADRFAQALALLPSDERTKWIALMARDFRLFPKIGDRSDRRIGGRRSIERVLSLLQDRGGSFLKAAELGEDPREIFDRLYADQARIFASEYQAADVLAIAAHIQRLLAKLPQSENEEQRILLTGSLINATARAETSDLDMIASNERLGSDVDSWQESIRSLVRTRVPESRLTLEKHRADRLHYWRSLNPFAIEVSANGIKLLVFTPATRDPANPERLIPAPPREFTLAVPSL